MIYLLTPTGDRPECLMLLFEYMADQTHTGPFTWIIVDDGETPLRIPKAMNIEYVRPTWRRDLGSNTQAANMSAGLARVPDDATLLVIEDDDVYLPAHIDTMREALRTCELVGERTSCYYNVATGRYKTLPSTRHASMASVGVRGAALEALRAVCAAQTGLLDITLWKQFTGPKRLLDTQNVIGIKGMPGRRGIGVGHRHSFGMMDRADMLATWIGLDRAEAYAPFRRSA